MNKDQQTPTPEDKLREAVEKHTNNYDFWEAPDEDYINDKIVDLIKSNAVKEYHEAQKPVVDIEKIKYLGVWTPEYLAKEILFPKPVSIQVAEQKLKSWAHDIIEANTHLQPAQSDETHKDVLLNDCIDFIKATEYKAGSLMRARQRQILDACTEFKNHKTT